MTESNQKDLNPTLPAVALWLGYLGLIPFVVLSFCSSFGVEVDWFGVLNTEQALLSYAAIIITFIGAVHWGIALSSSGSLNKSIHYLYSVIPSLLAWGLLFLPVKVSLYGMVLALIGLYLVDRALLSSVQTKNYLTLRLHLTVVAGLSMAIAGVTAG